LHEEHDETNRYEYDGAHHQAEIAKQVRTSPTTAADHRRDAESDLGQGGEWQDNVT